MPHCREVSYRAADGIKFRRQQSCCTEFWTQDSSRQGNIDIKLALLLICISDLKKPAKSALLLRAAAAWNAVVRSPRSSNAAEQSSAVRSPLQRHGTPMYLRSSTKSALQSSDGIPCRVLCRFRRDVGRGSRQRHRGTSLCAEQSSGACRRSRTAGLRYDMPLQRDSTQQNHGFAILLQRGMRVSKKTLKRGVAELRSANTLGLLRNSIPCCQGSPKTRCRTKFCKFPILHQEWNCEHAS